MFRTINGSRWGGERVTVGDLFFTSVTFPSFWHSVQDIQMNLLQDLQYKDFLVVMKQKSSMHSGEVSSNELTNFDDRITNNNYMNRRGLAMSAQRCYSIRDVAPAPLSAPALPHHLKLPLPQATAQAPKAVPPPLLV